MPSLKSLLLFTLPTIISASIHTIKVGENDAGKSGLYISPANTAAAVGDTVIFQFYPQHDVTEGPFDKPCTPTNGGFYSGAYSDTDDGKKKFVMNVTSTDPVYFYCSVGMHCKGGMVGGINVASGDNDVAAFAAAASKASAGVAQSSMSGGKLMDDAQIAALTGTASGTASGTAAPTSASKASGTAAQASASPTGAAGVLKGSVVVAGAVGGVLALVL